MLQTAEPLVRTRIILALLCVVVASALALGIAVRLNRRMQAIADQRPVKPLADEEEADTGDHIDRQ
ncbi:MAG TPA: hypothetical protein VFZ66_29295 [Herpetosiphonaceae bacterium]